MRERQGFSDLAGAVIPASKGATAPVTYADQRKGVREMDLTADVAVCWEGDSGLGSALAAADDRASFFPVLIVAGWERSSFPIVLDSVPAVVGVVCWVFQSAFSRAARRPSAREPSLMGASSVWWLVCGPMIRRPKRRD
jgi:hypothetical protein